jgi:hypothetical protein
VKEVSGSWGGSQIPKKTKEREEGGGGITNALTYPFANVC